MSATSSIVGLICAGYARPKYIAQAVQSRYTERYIGAMAALAQPTPLEASIAEALATVKLPKGVRLLRFYFDSDWYGDPAVRVVYANSTKIPLTKARARELSALSRATSAAVDNLQIGRFAYVKFDEVR